MVREESGEGREESEGCEGGIVCCAGVLQLLHHVSTFSVVLSKVEAWELIVDNFTGSCS